MTTSHPREERGQAGEGEKRYPYSGPTAWPTWKCPDCGCRSHARISVQSAGFNPVAGPLIRWGRTGAGPAAPIGKLDGSGWGRRRAPHNVLIERQDGSRVVRPFRGLRKLTEASHG